MDAFYSTTILGAPIYLIVGSFSIYGFLGVIVEMVFCLSQEGVLESRLGLLYIPLSPIYGIGAVALTQFLFPYFEQPVLLFLMGIVVGTVLEYVASFVMEKLFGTVFWDYSDKPFNLHGRVCLEYSIYWGLLSMLVLYILDPVVFGFVNLFSPAVGQAVLRAGRSHPGVGRVDDGVLRPHPPPGERAGEARPVANRSPTPRAAGIG